MNPLSSRRRMGSVLTSSTSPTRPMSTSSPLGSRWPRLRARRRPASFPDRPTAWPPWWLMSPTICLLILPTRTISTISTVSASVTRMPPTKRGSLPSRFISAPIGGGPQSGALMKRLGKEPRFVGGMRVTDKARLLAEPLHQRADLGPAPVHDDGLEAHEAQEDDVEREGLLEVGALH